MSPTPPTSAEHANTTPNRQRFSAAPTWLDWIEKHPAWIFTIITLACLLPFITKPFHIDDPMYIWAAEHIRHDPLNFYGFDVVWTGNRMPMPMAMQNPPLASYVMAAVSLVAGFSEIVLHLAFFVPAVLLVIGTWRLARRFCDHPSLAGMLTIITPVFMICSATLTNDILMVCLWVWAVYWWDCGVRESQWSGCIISAILIGLACMTKYPAVNLLPLLIAYTLLRRAPAKFLVTLLFPVAVLIAYELYTRHLYGRGLLSESAAYSAAVRAKRGAEPISKTFICLCFTGACLLPAMLLGPVLWRTRGLLIGAVLGIAAIVVLAMLSPEAVSQMKVYGEYNVRLMVQIALWFVAGVGVMSLTALDVWRRRDAEAVLLGLWIFGTFVFAGLVNWSVNGRSVLPMAPAVAMVIVRRLEDRKVFNSSNKSWMTIAAMTGSLVISMWLTFADATLARATRRAAERIMDEYGGGTAIVWFQGHWGFQHYMQLHGGKPWLPGKSSLKVGDLVVIPKFASNASMIGEPLATHVNVISQDAGWGVTTMNIDTGAGFYSHALGPLPFVFGPVPPEKFLIDRINIPFEPERESATESAD